MCLIVDANLATQVFRPDPEDDFEPIWTALLELRAVAVHGGKLTDEYSRIARIQPILLELDRRGALRVYPKSDVDRETENTRRQGLCCSDDWHIIALARVSRTRLLCSHDQDLHADFTNPQLLHPAGSVYQRRAHAALMRRHCAAFARRRSTARRGGRRRSRPRR